MTGASSGVRVGSKISYRLGFLDADLVDEQRVPRGDDLGALAEDPIGHRAATEPPFFPVLP